MSEIDEIFLIDDDDVDVMAIRRALLRISNPPKLIVANDGEEALNILSEGRLSLSAVIVLDINMPRISGFELLKKLRCNDELRSYRDLPVWVMT
ncbi:MAG: response regulator, partial [Pseudomonadota bacterium]|nr:response regulator [Pseudomonadota bacterium]